MWAQYNHILPHAHGGRSDLENVYLTCAACNYGRGNYLLEKFDLLHPVYTGHVMAIGLALRDFNR